MSAPRPCAGRPPRPAIQVSSSAPEGPQVPAALRMAPDGTFFVAWSDFNSAAQVYARRFAANGSPLTADFVVDLDGHRRDGFADLALLPSGGVVVVWTDHGDFANEDDQGGIFGHAFGPDGKPLSAHDFQVNRTAGAPDRPVLASRNGHFVAVWADFALDLSTRTMSGLGSSPATDATPLPAPSGMQLAAPTRRGLI